MLLAPDRRSYPTSVTQAFACSGVNPAPYELVSY